MTELVQDWFALMFGLCVVVLAVSAWRGRKKRNRYRKGVLPAPSDACKRTDLSAYMPRVGRY